MVLEKKNLAEQERLSSTSTNHDLNEKEVLDGEPGNSDIAKQQDEYANLNYPKPWRYEKFFLGGYSPKRMMGFKKPKTMYRAINLFAGKFMYHSSSSP